MGILDAGSAFPTIANMQSWFDIYLPNNLLTDTNLEYAQEIEHLVEFRRIALLKAADYAGHNMKLETACDALLKIPGVKDDLKDEPLLDMIQTIANNVNDVEDGDAVRKDEDHMRTDKLLQVDPLVTFGKVKDLINEVKDMLFLNEQIYSLVNAVHWAIWCLIRDAFNSGKDVKGIDWITSLTTRCKKRKRSASSSASSFKGDLDNNWGGGIPIRITTEQKTEEGGRLSSSNSEDDEENRYYFDIPDSGRFQCARSSKEVVHYPDPMLYLIRRRKKDPN